MQLFGFSVASKQIAEDNDLPLWGTRPGVVPVPRVGPPVRNGAGSIDYRTAKRRHAVKQGDQNDP
jgi:hypothetical protein